MFIVPLVAVFNQNRHGYAAMVVSFSYLCTLFSGFERKEFRGKLAIGLTVNFINRNTTAEAKVEEISGVAYIFNQEFFKVRSNCIV